MLQVKGIKVNDQLKVLQEASVQFDNDLLEYRTHGSDNVRGDGVAFCHMGIGFGYASGQIKSCKS